MDTEQQNAQQQALPPAPFQWKRYRDNRSLRRRHSLLSAGSE